MSISVVSYYDSIIPESCLMESERVVALAIKTSHASNIKFPFYIRFA